MNPNSTNKEVIYQQIQKKKNFCPYTPNPYSIFEVQTDVNEFPYRRFFRGKIDSDQPHIWDREAGFSPIITQLDQSQTMNSPTLLLAEASTPFQVPCSTQFPTTQTTNTFEPSQFGCVYLSP